MSADKARTRHGPVVVGWDGSAGAEGAVRWAAPVAARAGRVLLVLVAVDSQQLVSAGLYPQLGPVPAFDDVDAMLAKGVELGGRTAPDLRVEGASRSGHPVAVLAEASKQASLLVVGTRGHSQLVSCLIGSVSDAVAHQAGCPVVVVDPQHQTRAGVEASRQPVVVGVDGSERSLVALTFAAAHAETMGAGVVAVRSASAPMMVYTPDVVELSGAGQRALLEHAQAQLSDDLTPVRRRYPDLRVEAVVSPMSPVQALTEAVPDPQLLVVGSRGHGGFVGMLLGSVSRGVLHQAPCAVAVVR